MNTSKLDASFLDEALSFASGQVRHHVADALACHLHNEGYALEGNTEANDVEWFARRIWEVEVDPINERWETLNEKDRERYREIARAVLFALPAFQLRVAGRLITLSRVVRDIERASRPEKTR
jgi:hypothetical protein